MRVWMQWLMQRMNNECGRRADIPLLPELAFAATRPSFIITIGGLSSAMTSRIATTRIGEADTGHKALCPLS